MTDLRTSITAAFEYLSNQSVEIPADVWSKTIVSGVLKAAGDIASINASYHDAVTAALVTYLEGGSVTGPKNQMKRAMVEAFGSASDSGWVDGGADLPIDGDALEWFNARTEAELGYIDLLFQQAKELRKQEDFEPLAWASERADGYTNTLKEIYNNAKMRAMPNQMVTFSGDDGVKSCDTCQKLKGKRHKISWFVAHDYVPPFGGGLDCAKGGHCMHGLRNDKQEWITI